MAMAAVVALVSSTPSMHCTFSLVSSGKSRQSQRVVNVAMVKQKTRVELRTLRGCVLGVSWFPNFVYNGEGGVGVGSVEELSEERVGVQFDAENVHIPPLCYSTATFLGVPIPPPLYIHIKPQRLEGIVDLRTGKVEMKFVANFFFTAGSWYQPPPLFVDTLLTTEHSRGKVRSGHGSKLNKEGFCRLVGTAPLVRVDDLFLNTFLSLPTECLAEMSAQLQFS